MNLKPNNTPPLLPPPPYTEIDIPSHHATTTPLLPPSAPSAPPPPSAPLAPSVPQPYYLFIRSQRGTRHFPVNAAFFVLGCLFPPLWFFSCCCWNDNDRYERAWQKLNRWMAILSLISFILFTIFLGIMTKEEMEHNGPWAGRDHLDPLPPLDAI
ncbi:hypothetical protein EDC96DRAFT_545946 [Choanephora cucurbitarum]|nr:hypothetical protein EDC96DRAFT_545946 [Choanephora cucurbitarum]